MIIIAISSLEKLMNESAIINQLFKEGLDFFHIRKYNFKLKEITQILKGIEPEFLNKIVLHSHYELIKDFPLKGLHFSSHTTQVEYSENKSYFISKSIHSINEIRDSEKHWEYLVLSPVFDSISKLGYKGLFSFVGTQTSAESNFKNSEIKNLNSKIPIIALGGISPDKIPLVVQAGFDGIALHGYLWKDYEDCVEKFREINTNIRTFEHLNIRTFEHSNI